MSQIPESSLGRIKKGFYFKKDISPIWKRICEGTMTNEFRDKLIAFITIDTMTRNRNTMTNSIIMAMLMI